MTRKRTSGCFSHAGREGLGLRRDPLGAGAGVAHFHSRGEESHTALPLGYERKTEENLGGENATQGGGGGTALSSVRERHVPSFRHAQTEHQPSEGNRPSSKKRTIISDTSTRSLRQTRAERMVRDERYIHRMPNKTHLELLIYGNIKCPTFNLKGVLIEIIPNT